MNGNAAFLLPCLLAERSPAAARPADRDLQRSGGAVLCPCRSHGSLMNEIEGAVG